MRVCRLWIISLLAVSLAAMPLFGTTGAIVSSLTGAVMINGRPVTAGSAVTAGDWVFTGAAGGARLLLPGTALIAGPSTAVELDNINGAAVARLRQGRISISGQLPVLVAMREVRSLSSRARFDVSVRSGRVYVRAVTGKVSISAAGRSVIVPVGETLVFSGTTASSGGGHSGEILAYSTLGVGIGTLIWAIHTHNEVNQLSKSVSPSSL